MKISLGIVKSFVACSVVAAISFFLWILPNNNLGRVSKKTREDYIRKASIWRNTEIPRMDIFNGPQSDVAVKPEAEVICTYVEPEGPVTGFSPKFKCKLFDSGEVVRIKYHRRETFSEAAATRLLWALGFYTDENYPVKLRCMSCPEKNPFKPSKEERRIERVFDHVIMERDFPGVEIAQYPDQGFAWHELDLIDGRGVSTPAHVDALKLLAVFIQHTDSKRSQQRLACYEDDIEATSKLIRCKKPVLMIQDLGATFGAGGVKVNAASSMYLKGWERQTIWDLLKEQTYEEKSGQKTCFGNLTSAGKDGLFDPEIGEEGRAFLSDLLNQLTDLQIRDIFRVARADEIGEEIYENGVFHKVTLDDWVEVFKDKRVQIDERRCRSWRELRDRR